MTNIIAIASEKGGVSKTTTAVSIGGALVKSGREVLLIDLDPQASLTLALGTPPHTIRHSTADMLFTATTPIGLSRETSIAGLDLIPSNAELIMAERFLPIRKDYKNILKNLLANIQLYDTIILDCPPALGAITHNALVAANLLVIPTLPEYLSVYTLRNMLSIVRSIRMKDNPKLNYRILISMFDQRIGSHISISKQLRTTFKQAVCNTIIQVDTRLRDSTVAGIPITHFAANTRSAKEYRALAQELTQNV
ncbi:MAG: ParA family protein [Chloroflexi bacterium]|jgi:chromosome partitioning protein|nr:ParA family protein [Chloroflexota bacterium]